MAEAAGRRSKEPQQGSRNHREDCARVSGTHSTLQREPEARTLWARGRIVQKSFCFVLFTLRQLEIPVIKDSDPNVVLRKNFFREVIIRRSLSRSITNLWPAQGLNALNAYMGAPNTRY